MATPLPPPTGDAKNPPTEVTVWAKLFSWLYFLWKWVTETLPGMLTFGGDAGSYSSAIFATAGQSDTGGLSVVGAPIFMQAGPSQTAQSIPNNTPTVLTNWTAGQSSGGGWNATSGVYTVPLAGVYYVSGTASFSGAVWNATALSSIVFVNSTNVADAFTRCNNATASTGMQTMAITWVGYCKAGDTISLGVFHNLGVSQNTEGAHTNFCILRIGP